MINKQRLQNSRGGKVTRVAEKAVNAVIDEVKKDLKETLPSSS
jgi:hypothetical protein